MRQQKTHLFVKKYFSDLTEYFTYQNIIKINLMNNVVTLTFEIRQV